MDLTKYKFQSTDSFAIKTDKALLNEARERGFYNEYTPYNKLFKDLFFKGGQVTFKPNLDQEFKKKAWSYCRSFMSSFEPKHEEKEAICAMLMSELLELEYDEEPIK